MKLDAAAPRITGKVNIGDFRLESGQLIPNVELVYERSGPANGETILICHALTGNHEAVGTASEPGWWSTLIKSGGFIDNDIYQTISFNVLGGCNGSTGPLTLNPETGEPYQSDFPFITIRDIVNAQYKALEILKISNLKAVIGGSLGGMQVLEWGLLYPDYMELLVPIAVTPYLSDYAIAFNNIARIAIVKDPKWQNGKYKEDELPEDGFGIARMIGMITYRSGRQFNERFNRAVRNPLGITHDETAYEVESYFNYQGKKITQRFDANSYLYLLKAMDSHDIGRGRSDWKKAAAGLKAKVHCIAFSDDLLYPPEAVREFAEAAESSVTVVETAFGHDGFLVDFEKYGPVIESELRSLTN